MENQKFQVMRALAEGSKDFWDILLDCDGTIRDLFINLRELESGGTISFSEGRFHLEDGSMRDALSHDFTVDFRRFCEVSAERPKSVQEFFQGPLTDRDIFKRLKFIYDRGDIAGKEIFIIGDDDLFSVAIALTRLAKRIVVVEIDQRIVDLLEDLRARLGLDIEVVKLNCAHPLPEEYKGSFDVFICDPVETIPGFRTFISRGVSALRHPGTAYFSLTELECPPGTWHVLQKDMNSMNLVITDIMRKFSFYSESAPQQDHENFSELRISKMSPYPLEETKKDWYNSSFFRVQTVARPAPIITGDVEFNRDFYRDDFIMTVP